MKKNLFFTLSSALLFLLTACVLTACGDSDEKDDPVTPTVTINVRSCSVTNGSEYVASELKEVTISYNNVVAVNPSASITLNGTKGQTSGITTIQPKANSSDAYYDLRGHHLSKPTQKGLYIKNGHKVIKQ